MPQSFTLVASLRPLLGFMENRDFSVERLLADVELPPSILFNPRRVIPTSDVARLLGRVARHAGVERLGLLLGKESTPLDLGPLGHDIAAAPTLIRALTVGSEQLSLFQTGARVHLIDRGGCVTVAYVLSSEVREGRRHLLDLAVMSMVNLVRLAAGNGYVPPRIYVAPRPGRIEVGQFDLGDVSITMSDTFVGYDLPKKLLPLAQTVGMPTPSDRAAPFLEYPMGEIGAFINSCLEYPELSLNYIARKTHMSSRSLQRLFEQRGTSFQRFVNESRMQYATRLLSDASIRISEIAIMLGYEHVGNFSRAFKRWAQVSPQSFRESFEERQARTPGAMSARGTVPLQRGTARRMSSDDLRPRGA